MLWFGSGEYNLSKQAHRLKNDQTRTTKALNGLACKRRVLLSGTPLQNHLEEVRLPNSSAASAFVVFITTTCGTVLCNVHVLQPGCIGHP